jgi:hypothetical protein
MNRPLTRRVALACALLCSTVLSIRLGAQGPGAPTLAWRAGTGGNIWSGTHIITDAQGNVYSSAMSSGFGGAGAQMVFQKQDRDGNMLYSVTYGGRINEFANGLAVDAAGNLYVAGSSNSPDFTLTAGDPNSTNEQPHAFAMKLDPSGGLIYSYAIGEGPTVGLSGRAIAVDASGQAYVAYTRSDYSVPTASGRSPGDIVLAVLNPAGTTIRKIRTLSGNDASYVAGLAIDRNGRMFVAGETDASNYPVTPDALDQSADLRSFPNGVVDKYSNGFYSVVDPDGSLVYSTYIGGTSHNDYVTAMATDPAGNVFMAGTTASEDFPVTPGAFATTTTHFGDAFVMKWSPTGRLLYSSRFGASSGQSLDGLSLAVDAAGEAYLAVMTQGFDAPVTPDAFDTTFNAGQTDILVSRLSADGSSLVWSSFIGSEGYDNPNGIAIDPGKGFYLAGSSVVGEFIPSSSPNDVSYLHPLPDPWEGLDDLPGPYPFLIRFTWPAVLNTPAGGSVTVPAASGAASVSFGSVTAPGTTTIEPADAASLNLALPGGFAISGSSQAFEIHTSATVSGIQVCLAAPGLSAADFASAAILHGVNGAWQIESTTRDAATHTLCATVSSLSPFAVGVRLDTTPPSIQCEAAPAGWSAANVTLTCTAADTGLGLASVSDASFTLSTTIADGAETAAAVTGTRRVCDLGGNCATAGPIAGIRVDRRAPTVQIISPAGRRYLINEVAAAAYSCADGGVIASCTGTVPVGGNFNTAAAGSMTFTVAARDAAGHSASATASYTVGFNVRAAFDQQATIQRGKVLGVAIQLVDAAGRNVSSASIPVVVTGLRAVSNGAIVPLRDSDWLNPDHTFRFGLGAYVYALNTKGLTAGTYELRFTTGADPLGHTVQFTIGR